MSGAAPSAATLAANAASRKRNVARILIGILRRICLRRGEKISGVVGPVRLRPAPRRLLLSLRVAGPRERANERRMHRRGHGTVFAARGLPEDLVARDVRHSVG